jgi:hypothetical protein
MKKFILAGSSVQGSSHIASNTECQDYIYFMRTDKCAIMALGDGAGSAARGGAGSRVAVRSVMEYLRERGFPERVNLINMVKYARNSIAHYAVLDGYEFRDYATTLIVIISYGNRIRIAHIGDGGVVGRKGDNFYTLSEPMVTEYANETVFLTSSSYMKFLRTATFRDYDMLFAFTDGIQNAILEKRSSKFFPFKDFFETMASFTEENSSSEEMSADIKEMLESQRFKNISSDDKTFGVIYYSGEN